MEPAEIDWKKIVSKYERDEVYESISAPKWIDLSAPDAAVDDIAWFCRPDCCHPVNAEDFKLLTPIPKTHVKLVRSNSKLILAGGQNNDDANLKKRGGIATIFQSPIKPKLTEKFSEDLENQNPNLEATPLTMKRKKMAIAKKEAIKSSAERKCGHADEDRREAQRERSQPNHPKLIRNFSARNLFSGRDIFDQISEFCHELKKLATGRDSAAGQKEGKRKPKEEDEEEEEEEEKASVNDNKEEKEKALISTKRSSSMAKKSEIAVRVESNKEKSKTQREVKDLPPTPQRFPSPSCRRQPVTSKASTRSNSSPLGNPPKSKTPERVVLQALDQKEEEKIELLTRNVDNNRAVACETGRIAMNIFWFFKPCSYLVE